MKYLLPIFLLLAAGKPPLHAQFTFTDLPFMASGAQSTLWQGVTYPPPTIWLDVSPYADAGTPDKTLLTTWTNIGTGGGFFTTNVAPATALGGIYRDIDGGVFTITNTDTSGIQWSITNQQQYWGPTNGTMAVRMRFPGAPVGQALFQTGSSPSTVNYGAFTFSSTEVIFDYPQVNGNGRIRRVIPPGTTGAWFNAIFTRSGGQENMWFHGTNYCQSNGITGRITNVYSGNLTLMRWCIETNYLVKRVLLFPHPLNASEVALLDAWMTTQP